jgi:hypothetical protein
MPTRDHQFAQDLTDSVTIIGKTIRCLRGFGLPSKEAEALDARLDNIVVAFVNDGFSPDHINPDNVAALRALANEVQARHSAYDRGTRTARQRVH